VYKRPWTSSWPQVSVWLYCSWHELGAFERMLAAAGHPVQPHIRPGLDRSVPRRRYTDPYLRVFDLSSGSSLQREPSGSRRLRCAGSVAPHGADEEGTHLRLEAHFGQLVYPKINTHGGRIVKNTGNVLLAEFPSVLGAVWCAVGSNSA
jgi:hypothetical protein